LRCHADENGSSEASQLEVQKTSNKGLECERYLSV
jgi:hypothetical protein